MRNRLVVYKEENVFDYQKHLAIATHLLGGEPKLEKNKSFHLRRYYEGVSIGTGGEELAHVDWPCYQALLILAPNNWVLKGPRHSLHETYQQPGDLVIIDQSYMHEVTWDKWYPQPTKPWMYLFIDPHKREDWDKRSISVADAIAKAKERVRVLESEATVKWLSAGLKV